MFSVYVISRTTKRRECPYVSFPVPVIGLFINPVHSKSTFRYNSIYVQFHSGVVLFFVNFRVRVSVRVSYRVRVRDR